MKKFLSQFREFALRGNVMDLAVGVLIGGAFQGVVSSLTENILSPIIGIFTGRNFDRLTVSFLGVTLGYGAFITSVVNFIVMALVIFLLVRAMNGLADLGKQNDAPVPAAPATKACPYCASEIAIAATRCPHCTSQL